MPKRDDSCGTEQLLSARHLSYATLVMVGLMCVLCVGVLISAYRDTQRGTERNALNLSVLLARDVERDILLSQLALQNARDTLAAGGDVAHIDAGPLLTRASDVGYFGHIRFADAEGTVTGEQEAGMPGNVAQRDFFLYHRQHADDGLLISPPMRGDGEAAGIVLSMRVDRAGAFGGVIYTTVDLRDFYRLFGDVNVGPGGHIVLYRLDGTVLMEYPPKEDNLGRDLASRQTLQVLSGASAGTTIGRSAFDQVVRLRALHRVDGLPLILSVGIAMHDVFVGWREKAIIILIYTLLLGGATVGLALVLVRELTRRQELESELQRIARTDSLTQLGNRRLFDESLRREWERSARLRKPLALLMLDIDWFKKYNDLYGHPAGDVALRETAACIARGIHRSTDICARYGGEEFTVVLPDTNLSGAYHVAEKIRKAVERMSMAHQDSPLKIVTVSVGVAMRVPEPGVDPKVLIDGADEALYRAKQAGRNRVLAEQVSQAAVHDSATA